MNELEKKTLIEAVLYILEKTGGIDFYHLFKILYFADRDHLAEWGSRIIADDFYALDHGPVPTSLYDAIKENTWRNHDLNTMFQEVVSFAGSDAPNVLLGNRKANRDYLSDSEMAALDRSIKANASLTFGQLREKSHDAAWKEAFESSSKVLSPLKMAEAAKASSAMIDYIKEQEWVNQLL